MPSASVTEKMAALLKQLDEGCTELEDEIAMLRRTVTEFPRDVHGMRSRLSSLVTASVRMLGTAERLQTLADLPYNLDGSRAE